MTTSGYSLLCVDDGSLPCAFRKDLNAKTRFCDGEVRYHRGKPPDFTDENYYVKTDEGYFELARDGDGAFKSKTYYLNEARPTNALPESRLPNVKYRRTVSKVTTPFCLYATVPVLASSLGPAHTLYARSSHCQLTLRKY